MIDHKTASRLLKAIRGRRLWWSKFYIRLLIERISVAKTQKLPKWRHKPRNIKRNRGYAIHEIDIMSDDTFKKMFRIDRRTFYELVDELNQQITRNDQKAINSTGSAIPMSTRLAVTLRWLAGGQYLDLCFAWGLGKSTFFSERGVLWPTIIALDKMLKIGFPIDDD